MLASSDTNAYAKQFALADYEKTTTGVEYTIEDVTEAMAEDTTITPEYEEPFQVKI